MRKIACTILRGLLYVILIVLSLTQGKYDPENPAGMVLASFVVDNRYTSIITILLLAGVTLLLMLITNKKFIPYDLISVGFSCLCFYELGVIVSGIVFVTIGVSLKSIQLINLRKI